jgi:glycosyltransferase involved in cell wall biosynthesis
VNETGPADDRGDIRVSPVPSGLRIGVCLSLFPPVPGGAEMLLFELARRWVARGNAVTVFTRRQPGAPTFETMAGIQVRRTIRTLDLGPLFGLSFVSTLAWDLTRRRRTLDLLVAFQAPWESAATGLVAARFGLPGVVVLQQSGPFGDLAQLHRSRFAGFLAARLRAHRRFVGLSEDARRELIELGIPPERAEVIHNGIDIHRFHPPDEGSGGGDTMMSRSSPLAPGAEVDRVDDAERSRTVLFVGRLVDQKNPLNLIEAWARLNRPGARLEIIGAGPLEEAMRRRVTEGNVPGVHFLGRRSDMPERYRRAGVFALPSRGEGCCMALLEAMASGCAPVVTRVGGSVDVLDDGVTGHFVPDDDPSALAAALTRLLDDPVQQRAMGRAARAAAVERFDIDRVADRYLRLFEVTAR